MVRAVSITPARPCSKSTARAWIFRQCSSHCGTLGYVSGRMHRQPISCVSGRSAAGRIATFLNVRIWTPPHFASTPFSGDKVRLLTYIRPLSDLDQPRSGHDGLFARRLLIALSGFAPVDIRRLLRRRFDLFAILRGARNRGDVLLDQSERTGSDRHVLRFIVCSVTQHRPGDPRHLVGEGGCCHVRVRSLGQCKGPAAEPIGLAWRCS